MPPPQKEKKNVEEKIRQPERGPNNIPLAGSSITRYQEILPQVYNNEVLENDDEPLSATGGGKKNMGISGREEGGGRRRRREGGREGKIL